VGISIINSTPQEILFLSLQTGLFVRFFLIFFKSTSIAFVIGHRRSLFSTNPAAPDRSSAN
jgi:hypothetical protein